MNGLKPLKRVARPVKYDGQQNGIHIYYVGTDVERSRHVWKLVVVEHAVYDSDGDPAMSVLCGRKPLWLLEFRIRHALRERASSVILKGIPQDDVFETARRRTSETDACGDSQPSVLWDIRSVAVLDKTFDVILLGKVRTVNGEPLPDPPCHHRTETVASPQRWGDMQVLTEAEMASLLRHHVARLRHEERLEEMRTRTRAMRERNERAEGLLEQVRAIEALCVERSGDPEFLSQAIEDITRLLAELRVVTAQPVYGD